MEEDLTWARDIAALLLAILGAGIPASIYIVIEARLRDDLGWQEGFGFFVLVGCLLLSLLSEGITLWILRGGGRTIIGKLARGTAILCFAAAGAFLLWLGAWVVLNAPKPY